MVQVVRVRLTNASLFPLRTNVHAVVSKALDVDGTLHSQPRKPWSLGRVHFNGREIEIDVGLFASTAQHPLDKLVGNEIRLGKQYVHVDSAEIIASTTFATLASTACEQSSWRFEFLTPVVFRSGKTTITPSAGLVFGHLRAVWTAHADCPLPVADLDFKGLFGEHFDGHSVPVGPVEDWGREEGMGFVGSAMVWASSERGEVLRSLDALAGLASFTGIGAGTTFGCGWTTQH